jgi:hypothetical protein
MKRLLLGASGIALLIPAGGKIPYSWALNAIGAAACLLILVVEWRSRHREPARFTGKTIERIQT